MMDKIKTTSQLNNVVLMSMQPIGHENSRFAGKILTKYGVSRWTDHFMALVHRHYSNLYMEAKVPEGLDNPSIIKNYVNNINVYNRIVNWAGGIVSASRDKGNQQVLNAFADAQIISSTRNQGILERMLPQRKGTVGNPQLWSMSKGYLIHNTMNIIQKSAFSTAVEDSLGFESIRQHVIGREMQEPAFMDEAPENRVEALKSSHADFERSRALLHPELREETGEFSRPSFEKVSRINAKTLSDLPVKRSSISFIRGDQHASPSIVKGYSSNSKADSNELQLGVRNKTASAMNYSAQDIAEYKTTKSRVSTELTHKALYKGGMNQAEFGIDSNSQASQSAGLVLHKPAAAEASPVEQRPQHTELYDHTASSSTPSTSEQKLALNNIDSQDISFLADRVFKILEKRISIQKDRRGLL